MMYSSPGQVEHGLLVRDQERERQRGLTPDDIDCPGHVFSQYGDVGDECPQLGFVIDDASREEPFSIGVDHDAVVMLLSDVDACPHAIHTHLPSPKWFPSTAPLSLPYTAIGFAFPNAAVAAVVETPGGQAVRAISGTTALAIPSAPGCPGPYDWPGPTRTEP